MSFKISVVTVTFNCEKIVEETIKSVLSQTYSNIEYIIIDGGSKDNTLSIIDNFKSGIDILVSEPDKGIYDAMNKAIDIATGDYIIFMNAGDIFYNNLVVEDIFSKTLLDNVDVVYGSVVLVKKGKEIELKPGSLNEFWKGSRFCHQSAFISLKLHKQFPYDLKYKIAADYNFFNTMYRKNKKFLFIDLPFSKISLGGISDIGRIQLILENLEIANKKEFKVYYHYFFEGIKALILSKGKILTYYIFKQ